MMTQEERIRYYESMLREADLALSGYEDALEAFCDAWELLVKLNRYYGSPDWWQDFDDSEMGRIKQNCGVLSEDGIWDLLGYGRELLAESKARLAQLPAVGQPRED